MKRLILGIVTLGLFTSIANAKIIEQTICFSKKPTMIMYNKQQFAPSLGDNVTLYGGKCNKKILSQMNKEGWTLIQVIMGLQGSFGMVFEK